MAATTRCPRCQHSFNIPPEKVEHSVKCPACEHFFTAGAESEPVAMVAAPIAIPTPAAAGQPAVMRVGQRDAVALLPAEVRTPSDNKASPPPPQPAVPIVRPRDGIVLPPAEVRHPIEPKAITPQTAPAPQSSAGVGASSVQPAIPVTVAKPLVTVHAIGAEPHGHAANNGWYRSGILAYVALALGLAGFGLGWSVELRIAGVACASLGSLLALVEGIRIMSDRRGVPASALGAMAVCGQAIVLAALLEDMHRPAEKATVSSSAALSRSESSAVNLEEALRQSNASDRIAAATALGKRGRDVADAVPDLAEALNDEDAGVRVAAARALGMLGPWAKGAIPALTVASKSDASTQVQEAATEALEQIGRPTGADVPALVASLQSAKPSRRAAAAQLLEMLGTAQYPEARAAVGALRLALQDKEVGVRLYAALALWAIDNDPKVIAMLRNVLINPDAVLRKTAALGLASVGPQAFGAIPDLKQCLKER